MTTGIVHLARIYRKEVNRMLTAYGISESQAEPLLHLSRFGSGMRQNSLAEEIGLEGPSLVRLLDHLCARGLVERRDDEQDRRAKNLHLTPAGEELATRVEMALLNVRGQLLATLSDDDVAAGLHILNAFRNELQATAAAAKDQRI